MTLLLFKLLTTPTLVLAATLVSRRFGQTIGGWLVGLPLTSGPIAVFLALEHGADFAEIAATGSIEGTAAQACFAVVYARLAAHRAWPLCLLAATMAFVAAGTSLAHLALPLPSLAAVAIGALVVGLALIGRPEAPLGAGPSPRWDLPVRMAVATSLVLLITGIASEIGPSASGVAATFPLFALILAVFAHRHHGAAAAQSVLRGLLVGLFGFVGFFATVSLALTRTSVAAAFVGAIVVTLLLQGASFAVLRRSAGERDSTPRQQAAARRDRSPR